MSDNDKWAARRQAMIDEQLAARGVTDPRVLWAMSRVPREAFVDPQQQELAYGDSALPIASGQTISQPYIVGLMTQALALTGTERLLEIGTGSGYQTAILAQLVPEVVSIERYGELARAAAVRFAGLGVDNVVQIEGDGTEGWPERAPYERIIVTAAAGEVPPRLFEQLAEEGVMVIPLGDAESQVLWKITKRDGRPQFERLCGCRFVPLVGSAEPEGFDAGDAAPGGARR